MSSCLQISGHTLWKKGFFPGMVVIDAGANRGAFGLEMARQWQSRVLAIEPNPDLAQDLRKHPMLTVRECALGQENGMAEFHVAFNCEASSLMELPKKSPVAATLQKKVPVEVRRLEDVTKEWGVGACAVLKLDVEGMEVKILNELNEAWLGEIEQISIEFHDDPIFQLPEVVGVEECLQRLRRLGFLVLELGFPRRVDVLCLNQKKLKLCGVEKARLLYWEAGVKAEMCRWKIRLQNRWIVFKSKFVQ
jgi:FkbM family methyltransferase